MINQTFQFVTDGDYINFFVNNQICKRLAATSQAVNWVYDEEEGIIFTVNGAYCRTRNPEDISFDGTPLTTKEDFVTAIKAMFPVYAGGAGPGGNTIYTGDGTIDDATRTVTISAGNALVWDGGAGSSITSTADSHVSVVNGYNALDLQSSNSRIEAKDQVNSDTRAYLNLPTSGSANAVLNADYNDGEELATISVLAQSGSSSITSTADSHIFIGVQEFADNAAASGAGLVVGTIYRTGDNLKIVH